MSDENPVTALGPTSRRALLAGAGAVGATALPGGVRQRRRRRHRCDPPRQPGAAEDAGATDEPGGERCRSARSATSRSAAARSSPARRWSSPSRPRARSRASRAICTHQGCPIASVDGGTINCTCHGSKFSIERRLGADGPATRPLHRARGQGRGRQHRPGARRHGPQARSGPTPVGGGHGPSGRDHVVPSATLAAVADPSTYRPAPGTIPDAPGVYRFRDAGRPGHLRRQGQEPAQPAQLLLRRPVGAAPAHPADGHHGGRRRLGHGRHRGRGAPARILLDQGVRPAVQRPLPRRQVLPVPRRHPRRGVSRACR